MLLLSSNACMTCSLSFAFTRLEASRSRFAWISLRIASISPSATPNDFANSASISGSLGASTPLSLTSNVATFPATSLP